jgi:hypothetical protein
MRAGSQDNKGTYTADIDTAEQKIFDAQGRIDTFIIEKQPLEKEMLTLEAEIGPVKYIAALAVDWGMDGEGGDQQGSEMGHPDADLCV